MSQKLQKTHENPYINPYHYSLIKILIEDELNIRNDSWDKFLDQNVFASVNEIPKE